MPKTCRPGSRTTARAIAAPAPDETPRITAQRSTAAVMTSSPLRPGGPGPGRAAPAPPECLGIVQADVRSVRPCGPDRHDAQAVLEREAEVAGALAPEHPVAVPEAATALARAAGRHHDVLAPGHGLGDGFAVLGDPPE